MLDKQEQKFTRRNSAILYGFVTKDVEKHKLVKFAMLCGTIRASCTV